MVRNLQIELRQGLYKLYSLIEEMFDSLVFPVAFII